jgi:hypothetical protein
MVNRPHPTTDNSMTEQGTSGKAEPEPTSDRKNRPRHPPHPQPAGLTTRMRLTACAAGDAISACVSPCAPLVSPARRRSFSRAPGPSHQVGSRRFDDAQATRRTTMADGDSTFGGCECGTELGRCSPPLVLPATRDRRGRPRLPDRGIAPTREAAGLRIDHRRGP